VISRLVRWYDERPVVGDLCLARLLLAFVVPSDLAVQSDTVPADLAFSLALVACVPFRRRAPLLVFMEVVGEAADGRAALEALAVTRADVVLMDVRMPELDGVRATERLLADARADRPAPKVIVLTTFDLDEYVFAAIRAGASGFLLKDARPEDLLGAVRAVLSGDAVVAPSATRRLLEHVAHTLPAGGEDERLALLTPREREVLVEVARGRSNGEIAADLFMAEATVKTHVGRLLAKLEQRDRVQLAVVAYETGLVRAGPSA
jgi:DNA-binding NarL/FixJ family response regulator